MTQYQQLVRKVPLLARLPEGDVRPLASKGQVRSFNGGQTIFGQGDQGDSLHVIIEGTVRICVVSSAGDEATIAVMRKGECFGEMALLDGKPRSAAAIALDATKTLVVTRDDFIGWVSERPKVALGMLEELSDRLRRTDQAFADLSFLGLQQRLAKRLLDMNAELQARRKTQTGPIRIQITQSELAAMLGVTRETVNKQLNAFERSGWIILGRGSVTVKDPEGLATEAEAV